MYIKSHNVLFAVIYSNYSSYPITAVLPELDSTDDLLVDKVSGHAVLSRVVPWCEDLFPEEQPPGCIALLSPLLFSILFTLRHCIHHMVLPAAKRRHLRK